MKKKITVSQAIEEMNSLYKKILYDIEHTSFVSMVAPEDPWVDGSNMTKAEFERHAVESYQRIMNMITRYRKIKEAVHKSNAETFIDTEYGKMTIAEACKYQMGYEVLLVDKMNREYSAWLMKTLREGKTDIDTWLEESSGVKRKIEAIYHKHKSFLANRFTMIQIANADTYIEIDEDENS